MLSAEHIHLFRKKTAGERGPPSESFVHGSLVRPPRLWSLCLPLRQPTPVLCPLSCSSIILDVLLRTSALTTDLKKTRDGGSLAAPMVKNAPAM